MASPLTISELAARIKRLLEDQVGLVTITGEVSNLRQPASGHCYFLMKDASAAINSVCFKNTLARQKVKLADGMQLEATGRISAYGARSEYQIVIESMREAGFGELMRRYLELRDKLRAQGLFDEGRKRAIPRLPRAIGIVTSGSGAALRDMLNVLARRARGLTIYLAPCAVQGDAAPAEIVCSLERLQRHARAEVIIVGRGGGSIEDLWSFNDERVVRAIAACSIPVISAVGHETDTTLADFAADLRAPTPSAAAELVSAHYAEIAGQVEQAGRRLRRAMVQIVGERRARLERCRNSWGLRSPRERVQGAMQRLDDLRAGLELGMQRRLPRLAAQGELRVQLTGRLARAMSTLAVRRRMALGGVVGRLQAVNPSAVLERGYSIVTHGKSGRVIRDPAQVRPEDMVRIRSAAGNWRAVALPGEADLFDPPAAE